MPSRPNILFVFTDQQRADTLGAFNPAIRTPVMDRLCAEGTAFTKAYTPVPVCVPARCSLIFGQYAHKTACYENGFSMPETTAARPTFAWTACPPMGASRSTSRPGRGGHCHEVAPSCEVSCPIDHPLA